MQPNRSKDEYFPSLGCNSYLPEKTIGEQNTFLSYQINSRDVLAKIISERISFLKKTISEINRQIEERKNLKDALHTDINEKLLKTGTALLQMDSFARITNISSRRISLENMVAALYKEKRHQDLLHWQDTVKLEKDLRNASKELLSALRDLWILEFLS